MAKLVEDNVVITISRMIKSSEEPIEIASDEFLTTLETVVKELINGEVMIEVTRG